MKIKLILGFIIISNFINSMKRNNCDLMENDSAVLLAEVNSDNKSLPLLAELNRIIWGFVIEAYVKDCGNYDDYIKSIEKINLLRSISKSVNFEVNTTLNLIRNRLSASDFKNLVSDYKLSLLFLIPKKNLSNFWYLSKKDKIDFYINALENVNQVEDIKEMTALIIAADSGDGELIDILIKLGANVNIKDEESKTALMRAAYRGNKNIVQKLIACGADVNFLGYLENFTQKTFFQVIVQTGRKEIIEILIKYIDVNEKSGYGGTALSMAITHRYADIVKFLIENGADVNLQNNEGNTALMSVADLPNHAHETQVDLTLEIINILIHYGAKIEMQDANGQTALDKSIKAGHPKIIDLLKSMQKL